jgi:hypothetical protein
MKNKSTDITPESLSQYQKRKQNVSHMGQVWMTFISQSTAKRDTSSTLKGVCTRHIVSADCHCVHRMEKENFSPRILQNVAYRRFCQRMATWVNYLPLKFVFRKIYAYICIQATGKVFGYNHELLCSRCHCKIIEFKLGYTPAISIFIEIAKKQNQVYLFPFIIFFLFPPLCSTNLLSPQNLPGQTWPHQLTWFLCVLGPAFSWFLVIFAGNFPFWLDGNRHLAERAEL